MSCTNNTSNINKTFIIEPQAVTGDTPTLTACTAIYTNQVISCSGDTVIQLTSGATVFNTDLVPVNTDTISVGTPTRRFRELNSLSGTTTVWVATTSVETPELRLGVDSSGNTRTITANNSIIQDDCLLGGTY
jgi:hypothetical protein